jgi:Holliday junction resolvase-like predicted endonuclease
LPAQRDILVALLETTKKGPIDYDGLRETVRVTDEALTAFLDHLIQQGLVGAGEDTLEASLEQRLEIAVKAVKAGADLERVSQALGWLEFEEMSAYTFEANGYRVKRRFRFNAEGRRWEIDVLATRKPLVVCAECKHWSSGLGNMTARKIVEIHLEKVRVLSENAAILVEKGILRGWDRAVFVPMALSLQSARNKIYRRIPVVSVFELPSFLDEFQGQMEWLQSFPVDLPEAKPRVKQTVLKKKGRKKRKRTT